MEPWEKRPGLWHGERGEKSIGGNLQGTQQAQLAKGRHYVHGPIVRVPPFTEE